MNKEFKCVLIALIGFLFSTNVQALLVSEDSSFGSSSITRDTDTGLEWLDLDHTLLKDYSSVVSQFGPGGTYDGFRLATGAELEILFYSSAGISPTDASSTSEALFHLISLVGITFSSTIAGPKVNFFASTAFFDDGEDTLLGLASLETGLEGSFDYFSQNVFVSNDVISPTVTLRDPVLSAGWLVRASEIPAPAGIFWLGLSVLLIGRGQITNS